MTKIRQHLSIEQVLSSVIKKLDEDEIKNISNKSISHFRKCSDPEDKDHNLHLFDAIKLDILMQRKSLGTPILDNFELMLDEEFSKINSFQNIESALIKIGGRVGNLMDVVQDARNPESTLGKELSNKEKDLISKAIIELEEKIAKLKLSIK
tara:strand:+ start:3972 stop:4427 length:456 start_codon:yes stop_codon:yes gene_type:complete